MQRFEGGQTRETWRNESLESACSRMMSAFLYRRDLIAEKRKHTLGEGYRGGWVEAKMTTT